MTAMAVAGCCEVFAGCAGTPGAPPAPSGENRATAPSAPVKIPLPAWRKRLRTITVKAGSQTGTFMFDTGGGITQISPEFARKVGCEPWGRITGFQMMGARFETPRCNDLRLEVGGLPLTVPVAAVYDTMAAFPHEAEPVDGVLALDAFAGQALTLDLGHHWMTVETPESLAERTRTMREGQARLSREAQGAALSVSAAARTPKGLAWFELDSGNGGTLLVSQHIAPLLGLDPKGEQPQPARFDLVGGVTVEGNVHLPDMIIDGNVGMPFLSRWVITLDLARSRVWFEPGGPGADVPPPPPPK
ncbi:aspartyl protease family protein [Archangium sp.]|uniref:aspartyl protease family protein n=1 Tax=Archangium sp. TaxID=1872627 RepID=UPI00389A857D